MNRLQTLAFHGQSIWLDFTRREFVATGALRRLIDEDALTGVTSNPAIFAEAFRHGTDYDDQIRHTAERGLSAIETFEEIAIADIRAVADELRGVFDRTEGRDGYVSLEVSPHLAHDTEGTVAQAREFWGRVDRPNLFIKIPATVAGLPAIRRTIAAGINVNITLLFSLPRYRAVLEEYLIGLEERDAAALPLAPVASVASFFLSRIDLLVDPQLEQIAQREPRLARQARALQGRAAIACAKQAYQIFKEVHAANRFQLLALTGARPQRVLWASTSAKRPGERDVRYVEPLIGRDTINTLPLKTLEAFRDHGDPTPRLEDDLEEARTTLRELGEIGIDLEAVGRQLETEGVKKFNEPFDDLLAGLEHKLGDYSAAHVRH